MYIRQKWVGSKRKWQPTLPFLPDKSHGWRSLAGYSPWDRKELDTTRWLSIHNLALENTFTLLPCHLGDFSSWTISQVWSLAWIAVHGVDQKKTEQNSASVIPKDHKFVLVKAHGEKLMVSEQTVWWQLISVLEKEGCTWVVFYAGAVMGDDSACLHQENEWAFPPHWGILTGTVL